jgi:hypothetical protein
MQRELTPSEERVVIWIGIGVPWALYLIGLIGLGRI